MPNLQSTAKMHSFFFTLTGRMKCALLLAGRKITWFYPKILPFSNYSEKWLLLTYYVRPAFH